MSQRQCGLCGKVARTRDEKLQMSGWVDGIHLCHPDVGQDCYHLWTVYGRRP